MEPSNEPNNKITAKTLVSQLNAYCQADIKTLWTQKRLRNSHEVCGFSYVENQSGEWIMMPVLCPNCQHILDQVISGLQPDANKLSFAKTKETDVDILFPTPLFLTQSGTADTDYLLYQASNRHTKYKQESLEFYRPSLASNGCCSIL